MNKNALSILFITTLTTSGVQSCPTCIGRVEKNAPPIFSPEYDKQFWPKKSLTKEQTSPNESSSSAHKIVSLHKGKQS